MSAAGAELAELAAERGDAALAERIVAELGVESGAGATAGAGWGDYLRHLGAHLLRSVGEAVAGLLDTIPVPAGWPRALALVVAGAALALVATLAVRAILRGRRGGSGRSPEARVVMAGPAAPDESRGAAAWRSELEALLAAGRAADALRAAWWWLARSLAGERADPAWTGRELLEESGRRDLAPLVRRLEALTYGRSHAGAADLRALVAELEGAVA